LLLHREVAGAPVRSASLAWQTITDLVVGTLERSPSISGASVVAALEPLGEVGPALVAGGYLESEPVVLIASPVHLEITVVSGDEALRLEENTTPVPGGASATNWMLHVPAPKPLAAWVREATEGSDQLTTETPPSREDRGEQVADALVDLGALDALGTSER
jgi:hypothetical protein